MSIVRPHYIEWTNRCAPGRASPTKGKGKRIRPWESRCIARDKWRSRKRLVRPAGSQHRRVEKVFSIWHNEKLHKELDCDRQWDLYLTAPTLESEQRITNSWSPLRWMLAKSLSRKNTRDEIWDKWWDRQNGCDFGWDIWTSCSRLYQRLNGVSGVNAWNVALSMLLFRSFMIRHICRLTYIITTSYVQISQSRKPEQIHPCRNNASILPSI